MKERKKSVCEREREKERKKVRKKERFQERKKERKKETEREEGVDFSLALVRTSLGVAFLPGRLSNQIMMEFSKKVQIEKYIFCYLKLHLIVWICTFLSINHKINFHYFKFQLFEVHGVKAE